MSRPRFRPVRLLFCRTGGRFSIRVEKADLDFPWADADSSCVEQHRDETGLLWFCI